MCYRIQSSAEICTEIARIAREQIAQATKELASKTNPADKIHNVRRCLKRVRSLLKLLRPQLSPQLYETENRRFRDLGRAIAPIRDYYVTLQTFDALKLPKNLRNPLCLTLAKATDVKKGVAELRALKIEFDEASKSINDWSVPPMDLRDLAEGLQIVYRDARKAFKKARKAPLPAKLHQWRQRVKVLEHNLRLIEPFCPKLNRRSAKKSDVLADLLGNFNDLYLLGKNLQKLELRTRETEDALSTISRKSKNVQKRALKLGQKVFSDKPSVFSKKYHSILNLKTPHD